MESLLKTLGSMQGVTRSSDAGEVFDVAGAVDADTLAAVAAVSAPALREVGELLAAGRLERWYLVTEQNAYYGSERGRQRILAVGEAVKNPEASSKRLHDAK